ncbi:uncharacterized protein LOC144641632 [Oculina patagonica]
MNTFNLARIVLLVTLGISLSSSSPLERLKRTLDDEAEDPGCNIPGVWSCNSGKREMQTLNAEPELKTVAEPAKLSSAAARGCNIPGVWACSGVTQLSGDDDSATSQLQGATTEGNGNNFDDNQSEDDPDKCPLGNLDCRRKRMLKRMLKQSRRVERSAKRCPPGIWVC